MGITLEAVAAEARQARPVAHFVADDDALAVPARDQRPHQLQPRGVVRHVDVGKRVIGVLLPGVLA
jgi:hypothetical protein